MSIQLNENNLFQKWIDADKIVKDGVIDEKSYLKSSKKILVIMKETYGGLDEWNNDLRIFLKDGGRSQTWNNIVRWTYGLQNLNIETDLLWNDILHINNTDRINQLKNIVSINLKKKPGGSSTISSQLNKEAKQNIKLLKEQVKLYNPDIVLCGSKQVGNLVQEMELFGNFKFTEFGKVRLAYIDNKLIISYFHPQVRGKGSGKEALFKNLINTVKNYKY